jgi:hypothetical protein
MSIKHRYVITTGWWCTEKSAVSDTRRITAGSDEIRSASFFKSWHAAVDRFTDPVKILVVDSKSPTPPDLPSDPRIQLLSLDRNPGHSSNHAGKFSGVTLAHICGMIYAFCCDVDYWVYIEQDALIYGDKIVETAISSMKRDYMWGSGVGIPQPMQQSMMIVRTMAIPTFLRNLTAIKARDQEMTPEMKFVVAASLLLRWLPECLFHQIDSQRWICRGIRKLRQNILAHYALGFDVLPFGYGQNRPLDFSAERFYFQHGSQDELDSYFRRL